MRIIGLRRSWLAVLLAVCGVTITLVWLAVAVAVAIAVARAARHGNG